MGRSQQLIELERVLGGVTFEVRQDAIEESRCSAIVNPTSETLDLSGPVSRALIQCVLRSRVRSLLPIYYAIAITCLLIGLRVLHATVGKAASSSPMSSSAKANS